MFNWFRKVAKIETKGENVYINPSKTVSKSRNEARIGRLELALKDMDKSHPDYENLLREYNRRVKIRNLDEEE